MNENIKKDGPFITTPVTADELYALKQAAAKIEAQSSEGEDGD